MSTHSSASAHEETPHATEATETITISDALKRRAQALINDSATDPQWRAIIRYGLESNDPWLADLVRRADAGERIIDTLDFSLEPEFNNDDSSEEKIAALVDLICRDGDESETKSAALLVLMGMLENSRHPKLLANAAKHFAFSRCGELNVCGMVDAQIAIVESELLASDTLVS